MNKKLKILAALLFATASVSTSTYASAAEEGPSFNVSPKIESDNLTSGGYFDLLMPPGTSKSVEVKISNLTDENKVINVSRNFAWVNNKGIPMYHDDGSKEAKIADKSLKWKFQDISKSPDKVTLAPKESKDVTVEINMPKETIDGTISGGLKFAEEPGEAKNDKAINIDSKYQYVISVLLSQQEKPAATPNLNLLSAEISSRYVKANIQNDKMAFLKGMMVESTLKNSKGAVVAYAVQSGMSMVPNSNFNLEIPLSATSEEIKPGDYELTINAYGNKDDKGKYSAKNESGKTETFSYYKEMTSPIKVKSAIKAAPSSKEKESSDNSKLWYIIALASVLLLGLIILIIKLKNGKDEDSSKEKD